jgi:MarR family transcriptional regulator, 2-MHQ and catechol-resistance regulon repressor
MTTEQAILGTIPNPHLNAIVNVKITHGWICKLQDDFYKSYQITHQQYNILRILKGQHGKDVSIMDIKRRMIDKMSNVGRLVEKLVQKGFVERSENAQDRRVVFVHLTQTGSQLLDNMNLIHTETMVNFFDNITENEAQELTRILEKMRAKPMPQTCPRKKD